MRRIMSANPTISPAARLAASSSSSRRRGPEAKAGHFLYGNVFRGIFNSPPVPLPAAGYLQSGMSNKELFPIDDIGCAYGNKPRSAITTFVTLMFLMKICNLRYFSTFRCIDCADGIFAQI